MQKLEITIETEKEVDARVMNNLVAAHMSHNIKDFIYHNDYPNGEYEAKGHLYGTPFTLKMKKS